MNNWVYRRATMDDLEQIWDKNIADNPGDSRWAGWKLETIADNRAGRASTFVAVCDGAPTNSPKFAPQT